MTTDGIEELRRLVAAFPEELPSLSARGGALIAAWQAEREQAAADRAALEQTRVQLAGCLAAAEGHISPDVIATPGMYGWSPAYQAVLDTRVKLEEAYKALEVIGTRKDTAESALAQARALLADYEAHCQRTPDGDLILRGNDVDALLAALSGGAR